MQIDFNFVMGYLTPLLYAKEIDMLTIVKATLLMLTYLFSTYDWKSMVFSKKKDALTYTHVIKYAQVYGKSGYGESDMGDSYKILNDFILKHLTDTTNNDYKTCWSGRGKIITCAKDIQLEKNITANIYTTESVTDGTKRIEYIVELSTKENSSIVHDLLDKIRDDYYDAEEKKRVVADNQYIVNFIMIDADANRVINDSVYFETSKSFDNLFFKQKNYLLDNLNYFLDNKQEYDRLGRAYTFGMLLSGPPGCGKTSCIKAIAKYTKRNILKFNSTKITDIRQLEILFARASTYNPSNSILVFEEIDCGYWADIVRSRKLPPIPVPDMIEIKEESKLTLGDFLEFLDGIVEYPGRMIIMTSNNPEILDEALLRPGRIDLNLELTALERVDVNNFYKLWFDEDIPVDVYENMHDYTFTQADLGLLFSSKNKETIHTKLTRN